MTFVTISSISFPEKEKSRIESFPELEHLKVQNIDIILNLSNNSLRRLPRLVIPNLEVLDLSNNYFTGHFGIALGLKDADKRSLSRRNSVGHIAKTSDLSIFRNLKALDLSSNDFNWTNDQILVVVSTMHRCFPVLQNLLLHENPFVKRFCYTRKSMYGLRAIFANNLFQLKSFSPPKFDGKLFDLKLKNEEMFQALWRKPEANAESVADVEKYNRPWHGIFFGSRDEYSSSLKILQGMHVHDGVVHDIGLEHEKEVKSQDSDDVGDMVDEVENTASNEKGSAKKGISASGTEKNGMKLIEDHFVAKYVAENLNLKLRELKKEIYDGKKRLTLFRNIFMVRIRYFSTHPTT